MISSRRLRRVALAMSVFIVLAAPAFATNHLMVIQEVFVGPPDDQPSNGVDKFTSPDARAQYVMLRMTAAGQTLVATTFVRVEDATGNILGRFGTFTANVATAGGLTCTYTSSPPCPAILIGTQAADDLFPCSFDRVVNGEAGRVALPAAGGRACFLNGPTSVVDCAAWGNFSCSAANCPGGMNARHVGDTQAIGNTCDQDWDAAAAGGTGLRYGKALQRSAFTCAAQNNSLQFALAFPRAQNNVAPACSNLDTDMDGLVDTLDCQDTGAGANTFLWPVIEVQNERVAGSGTSTISWDPQTEMSGSGVRYDVARGTLFFINGFTDDTCFNNDLNGTSTPDPSAPTVASVGFYYLERAGQNAPAPCRPKGTYGSGTTGAPSRDTNLAVCP